MHVKYSNLNAFIVKVHKHTHWLLYKCAKVVSCNFAQNQFKPNNLSRKVAKNNFNKIDF